MADTDVVMQDPPTETPKDEPMETAKSEEKREEIKVNTAMDIIDDKPSAEEPAAEKPTGEEPTREKPIAEDPVAENPTGEEPAAEEPAAEKPTGEEPTGEVPAAEQPAGEQPAAEQPAGEEPVGGEEELNGEEIVEKEKELEEDDLPDDRPSCTVAGRPTKLSNYDALINTNVSEGCIAQPMDHSFPFLYGACRANRGVKNGRYFYEAHVISHGTKHSPEFKIGFCTKESSLLGGKCTILFDSQGFLQKGEETKVTSKRFAHEVVSVLLNLNKESPNYNTVSLFIDGVRASQPIMLPDEMKDTTLYPHLMPKFCAIAVKFRSAMAPLPFKARMIDDAPQEDVEEMPKPVKNNAEVIIPFGGNCIEWGQEFCKKNPECVLVTQEMCKQWSRESGGHQHDRASIILDGGKTLCRIMNVRERRYVYAFGSILTSEERTEICKRFPNLKRTCYVNWSPETPTSSQYEKTSLPSEEEGFTTIEYETDKAQVEIDVAAWQKKSKLHSLVEGLKPGVFTKEKIAEYDALRKAYKNKKVEEKVEKKVEEEEEEKEKEKEEDNLDKEVVEKEKEKIEETDEQMKEVEKEEKKEDYPKYDKEAEEKEEEKKEDKIATPTDVSEWTEEDWMLADLRVELHLLCHGFCADVDDKERYGFALTALSHYYRLYYPARGSLRYENYACDSMQEVLTAFVEDTIKVKDSVLMPVFSKDEPLETFIAMAEEVRNTRTERVGAGDESAALKFKAQQQKRSRGRDNRYDSGRYDRGDYRGKGYSDRDRGYGMSRGGDRDRYSSSGGGYQGRGGSYESRGGGGGSYESRGGGSYESRGGSYGGGYSRSGGGGSYTSGGGSYGGRSSSGGGSYPPRSYGESQSGYGGGQSYRDGRQQQWGGVKRDYPSGGFNQQQPRRY